MVTGSGAGPGLRRTCLKGGSADSGTGCGHGEISPTSSFGISAPGYLKETRHSWGLDSSFSSSSQPLESVLSTSTGTHHWTQLLKFLFLLILQNFTIKRSSIRNAVPKIYVSLYF